MRKIVEDILDLNHHARNPEKETVAIEGMTKEVLKAYEVQRENRKLVLTIEGRMVFLLFFPVFFLPTFKNQTCLYSAFEIFNMQLTV